MELTVNQAKFALSDSNVAIFQSGMRGGKQIAGISRIKRMLYDNKIFRITVIVPNIQKEKEMRKALYNELLGFRGKVEVDVIVVNADLVWIDELPCRYNQITFTPNGSVTHIQNSTFDNNFLDPDYKKALKGLYKKPKKRKSNWRWK